MDRLICHLFGHDAWIESDEDGPYQHSCVRCGWQHPWHGLDPRADLLEPAPVDLQTVLPARRRARPARSVTEPAGRPASRRHPASHPAS